MIGSVDFIIFVSRSEPFPLRKEWDVAIKSLSGPPMIQRATVTSNMTTSFACEVVQQLSKVQIQTKRLLHDPQGSICRCVRGHHIVSISWRDASRALFSEKGFPGVSPKHGKPPGTSASLKPPWYILYQKPFPFIRQPQSSKKKKKR